METIIGKPLEFIDTETHKGFHDFEFRLEGDEFAAVEVTTATEMKPKALSKALEVHGHRLRGVDSSLYVWLTKEANVKAIHRDQPQIASALSFLMQFEKRFHRRDRFRHPAGDVIHNLNQKYGIERGRVAPSTPGEDHWIQLLPPGSAAFTGPDAVLSATQKLLDAPDQAHNIHKLVASGAHERHLFLWIEPHDFRWNHSLCSQGLPTETPDLPCQWPCESPH